MKENYRKKQKGGVRGNEDLNTPKPPDEPSQQQGEGPNTDLKPENSPGDATATTEGCYCYSCCYS